MPASPVQPPVLLAGKDGEPHLWLKALDVAAASAPTSDEGPTLPAGLGLGFSLSAPRHTGQEHGLNPALDVAAAPAPRAVEDPNGPPGFGLRFSLSALRRDGAEGLPQEEASTARSSAVSVKRIGTNRFTKDQKEQFAWRRSLSIRSQLTKDSTRMFENNKSKTKFWLRVLGITSALLCAALSAVLFVLGWRRVVGRIVIAIAGSLAPWPTVLAAIWASRRSLKPRLVVRAFAAGLIGLISAIAQLYPWLRYGSARREVCAALLQQLTSGRPGGSPWQHETSYSINVVALFFVTLAAVPLTLRCHMPSPHSRAMVWCALVNWLACTANVARTSIGWCPDPNYEVGRLFLIGCANMFVLMCACWSQMLLVRRVTRLAERLEQGAPLFARIMVGVLPCIGLLAALMDSLEETIASGVLYVTMGLGAAFSVRSLWVCFRTPLRLLRVEALSGSGFAQSEATWAMKQLLSERRAVLVSMLPVAALFLVNGLTWLCSSQEEGAIVWNTALATVGAVDACARMLTLAELSGALPQHAEMLAVMTRLWESNRMSKHQQLDPLHETGKRKRSVARCSVSWERDLWSEKVRELAHRSVSLEALLDFYCTLGPEGELMPHYDPRRSTTSDVVRQAIIPYSKTPSGTGKAMAEVFNEGRASRASRMVTHCWSNRFLDLVAAIVAHGLGEHRFDRIAEDLARGRVDRLRKELGARGTLSTTYWICAFCVNQHASICQSFGPEPEDRKSEAWAAWDSRRRDTVTGQIYPLCSCSEAKFFNDQPEQCELNKFDDMMSLLHELNHGLEQLIVVDAGFELWHRAWCLAELVEADRSGIPQYICIHSLDILDSKAEELSCLRIQDCKASREEDKAAILARIKDPESFNIRLRDLVLGQGGLMNKWMDAESRMCEVGQVAVRAFRRATRRLKRAGLCSNLSSLERLPSNFERKMGALEKLLASTRKSRVESRKLEELVIQDPEPPDVPQTFRPNTEGGVSAPEFPVAIGRGTDGGLVGDL